MKLILIFLVIIGIGHFSDAESLLANSAINNDVIQSDQDTEFSDDGFDETDENESMEDAGFEEAFEMGVVENQTTNTSWFSKLMEPARFTLAHEQSYKTEAPQCIQNNRSSVRLEYSDALTDYLFFLMDSKISLFWANDHRAKAEDKEQLIETNTREAFIQTSYGDTSIKAGIQQVIWGESDGGAITDVISPRDLSELFFISLEASRIGQGLISIDQFTSFGDWSIFYIPNPKLNALPEKGTAYYFDPFDGQAIYREEKSDESFEEYGLRWKKSIGKSDISLMSASLIDNNFAYQLEGYSSAGRPILLKKKQRYSMVGVAFNIVHGSFLYKGEIAKKSPKAFNNSYYQIEERNVLDTALGLEYSPGGNYMLNLEIVNNHIEDWDDDLQGFEKDTFTYIAAWNHKFLHDDLTFDWLTSYTTPYIAYLHTFSLGYQWNDQLKLELKGFYPDIRDDRNELWQYRDQKQISGKIQFQF